MQLVLAQLNINELKSASDAYQHLNKSLAEQYPLEGRALPIPAFNADFSGGSLYLNTYFPVDESETDSVIETWDGGNSTPRYALPYGIQTFFDFSASVDANSEVSIAQSYVWVDDVLTSNPQIKIRLFGLDKNALINENRGIGYTIRRSGLRGSDQTAITVVVDPELGYGSIFKNGQLLWDEVKVLGAFRADPTRASFWLPLNAVELDYDALTGWDEVSIRFFLFDLESDSLRVVRTFPEVTSSFEEPKALASNRIRLEFAAKNRRTEYPYVETDGLQGCHFAFELSHVGVITLRETGETNNSRRIVRASFQGNISGNRKPDLIGSDGSASDCSGSTPYESPAVSFSQYVNQQALTVRDVLRLFTPVHAESLDDGIGTFFFLPDDAASNPNQHIDRVDIDPITNQVRLKGRSSCESIFSCSSSFGSDDVFDWSLTLTPL